MSSGPFEITVGWGSFESQEEPHSCREVLLQKGALYRHASEVLIRDVVKLKEPRARLNWPGRYCGT